jgi:hypothetical protein
MKRESAELRITQEQEETLTGKKSPDERHK